MPSREYKETETYPRLKSFGGKAKNFSPRARIRNLMGLVIYKFLINF